MTLAYPGWLLLLALGPLIVLLHMRRPRRTPVSSSVVWRRVALAAGASTQARDRAVDWPLLLQLATVLALSVALAHPLILFQPKARHRVYLLDGSHQMQSIEDGRTALDAALDTVRRELLELPTNVEVTVVLSGLQPRALAIRMSGREAADRLDDVVGWSTASEWLDVINLAEVTLRPGERSVLTLLTVQGSLGGVVDALQGTTLGSLPRREVVFGPEPLNVGFVGAGFQRVADEPGVVEVVGSIAATEAVQGLDVLVLADDGGEAVTREVLRLTVDVAAGAATPFRTPPLRADGATITLSLAVEDANPADDEIALPLDLSDPLQVLVVGDVSRELGLVLSLIDGIEVRVTSSGSFAGDAADLVIITDAGYARVPATSTLWLGSAPGSVQDLPLLTRPVVTDWSAQHGLAGDSWSDLMVDWARVMPLLAGATPIVSSGGVPLIQSRVTEFGYQVVVSFSLEASNWPTLVSFPAFMAELIDAVRPPERRGRFAACVAGEVCRLGASHAHYGLGVDLGQGVTWPPVAGRPLTGDDIAQTYLPLGGAELSFIPSRMGSASFGSQGEAGFLPVVANLGGFEVTSPTDDQDEIVSASRATVSTMRLTTRSILVLVTLLLVLVNAILLWSRRRRIGGGRALVAVGVTALLVVAILAALLRLPFGQLQRPSMFVAVADLRSDGAVLPHEGTVSLVIAPGEQVPWGAPDQVRQADLIVPDLVTAFEVAEGLTNLRRSDRILLLPMAGQGATSTEVAALATRLLARSARVDTVVLPLLSPSSPVTITSLKYPRRVSAGSTADVLLSIEAAGSLTGTISMSSDEEVLTEVEVDLVRGVNALRVPLQFPTVSVAPVLVTLRTESGGVLDSRQIVVDVVAGPRTLVVGSDGAVATAWSEALRLQGFEAAVQPPLNVPWSVEAWEAWDLLVLLDVPAHSLHSTQLEAMQTWVERQGGGVVILGGEHAFGPGGYLRTPLDELSPLSSEVKREAPAVTMLFVIDRSGSMQQQVAGSTRMEIAKEAAASAIELLGPGSRVGVVVFDSEAEVLVPLTPVEAAADIQEAIERIRAGGGTSLYPALTAVADELAGDDSAAKHVVVLTDGMSQAGDFASAIAALKSLGATIAFVGIGSGADRVQLNDLAAYAGGALHVTDDVRALPSILAQEALLASEDLVRNGSVLVEQSEAGFPATGVVAPAGRIEGYVLTEAKPSAQVQLWSDEPTPAPILATWRHGLGRVVAFASQGAGPWVENWLPVEAFAGVWGSYARWASGTDLPEGIDVELEANGLSIVVTAHAFDASGTPSSGALIHASLTEAGAERTRVRLLESRHGVYTGALAVAGDGIFTVSVTQNGTSTVGTATVAVESGRSTDRPNPLKALVSLTDGDVLESSVNWGDSPSERGVWMWRPATTPWLVLALVLFLVYLVIVYGVPRLPGLRGTRSL